MKFTKMEGLGNDYIYVDAITQNISYDKDWITKISDRHFGIGADGLIALEKSDSHDFKMRMFNSDGSEGKMCGNGIRCLAKFAYDHHFTEDTHIRFETLSGTRIVDLKKENDQITGAIVDMGEPEIKTSLIPMKSENETCVDQPIVIDGQQIIGTAVSMGNPHFVIFVDKMPEDIETLGRKIETSSYFPEQVNVEFVEVINDEHIKMRVWERGSGETFACGTGACACMYASYLTKRTKDHVKVTLLGGDLNIHLNDDHHIMMEGPATTVFEGEI